jgi:hypothetical protein
MTEPTTDPGAGARDVLIPVLRSRNKPSELADKCIAALAEAGYVIVSRDDLETALLVHRDIPCEEATCFAVYRLHDALAARPDGAR